MVERYLVGVDQFDDRQILERFLVDKRLQQVLGHHHVQEARQSCHALDLAAWLDEVDEVELVERPAVKSLEGRVGAELFDFFQNNVWKLN